MGKIKIQLYFEDEQYDVLVFDENDNSDDELTDYAFQSKEEAHRYIEKLKQHCDIIDIKEINGEEELEDYCVDDVIQPSYLTYILDQDELKPTLETLFFKKNGFQIPLSVEFDSEYIYMTIDKSATARQISRVKNLYGGLDDFREDLLDDVFGSAGVRYSVPWDDNLDVHILVPVKQKRTC